MLYLLFYANFMLTFPDVISRDTGIRPEELKSAMEDRDVWRGFVQSVVSTEVEK